MSIGRRPSAAIFGNGPYGDSSTNSSSGTGGKSDRARLGLRHGQGRHRGRRRRLERGLLHVRIGLRRGSLLVAVLRRRGIVWRRKLAAWRGRRDRYQRRTLGRTRRLGDRRLWRPAGWHTKTRRQVQAVIGGLRRVLARLGSARGPLARRRGGIDLQDSDRLAGVAARKEGEKRRAKHDRPEHDAS